MTETALLLIDIQNDYFPSFTGSKMPVPRMDAAAQNAAKLLATARDTGTKVIHIRHIMASSAAPFFHPDTTGAEIHGSVAPISTETVVEKRRPNSFVGTNLNTLLQKAQIEHLIICGAMSQMCVDATVRAGVDLGFHVTVAKDACAAAAITYDDVHVPAELVHTSIMAPLAASYAKVLNAMDVLALMRG